MPSLVKRSYSNRYPLSWLAVLQFSSWQQAVNVTEPSAVLQNTAHPGFLNTAICTEERPEENHKMSSAHRRTRNESTLLQRFAMRRTDAGDLIRIDPFYPVSCTASTPAALSRDSSTGSSSVKHPME